LADLFGPLQIELCGVGCWAGARLSDAKCDAPERSSNVTTALQVQRGVLKWIKFCPLPKLFLICFGLCAARQQSVRGVSMQVGG
jgi:hypothetical protein